MASRIPESTRALVIKKCSAEATPVYHHAVLETRPLQQLKQGEVLVKMGAVSFNHRDVSDMTGLASAAARTRCSSERPDSFGYALVNTPESTLEVPSVLMEQVLLH